MRIVIVCFSLLFAVSISAQKRHMFGSVFEEVDTLAHPFKEFPELRSPLPERHDLAYLLPEIGDQQSLGSCVAWSSVYYAFTIVRRVEENDVNYPAFSAIRFHSKLKKQYKIKHNRGGHSYYLRLSECDEGSYRSDAADRLVMYGAPPLGDHNVNKCTEENINKVYPDRLYNWNNVRQEVDLMKQALFENSPLVFGIPAYSHNCWQNDSDFSDGVWNGVLSGSETGGHAMCIVGYDDEVGEDGAFKVVNSWDSDWGNGGFFWIQYRDIGKFNSVIQYELNPNKNNKLPTIRADIQKIGVLSPSKNIAGIHTFEDEFVISYSDQSMDLFQIGATNVSKTGSGKCDFSGASFGRSWSSKNMAVLNNTREKITVRYKRGRKTNGEYLTDWQRPSTFWNVNYMNFANSKIKEFEFTSVGRNYKKDHISLIMESNTFSIWNIKKSRAKIVFKPSLKYPSLIDCSFDQNFNYAHGLYSNGKFVRYELSDKIKRTSKSSYRNRFDLIIPDRQNLIAIRDRSIYNVYWAVDYSGRFMSKLKSIVQKPRMRLTEFDFEIVGDGKVSQVQYDESSDILVLLCGKTINVINMDEDSRLKIEVPSKSSNIQIFYDPQRDRVICHYDETISIFNTNSGIEVIKVSNISAIYTGNEDPSNAIPLKRRVNNEMNYIIAVDNQGNIKMINL